MLGQRKGLESINPLILVSVIGNYNSASTLLNLNIVMKQFLNHIDCLIDLTNAIKLAVDCLKTGGVIAVPTDTIYGLAGLTQMDDAVNKIYDIKARNTLKPISVSVSQVEEIYK